MKGHAAFPVEANQVYRKDKSRGPLDEKPSIFSLSPGIIPCFGVV
jgi:hypothetical protein